MWTEDEVFFARTFASSSVLRETRRRLPIQSIVSRSSEGCEGSIYVETSVSEFDFCLVRVDPKTVHPWRPRTAPAGVEPL